MAAMSLLLVVATATRWERIMATGAAPWISSGWLIGLIVGITALGTIPELTATASPILFGIAAVSGLLLTWWTTLWSPSSSARPISVIAFSLDQADAIGDVVAPVLTVMVVGAATALVGFEFEKEAVVSAEKESKLEIQRLDLNVSTQSAPPLLGPSHFPRSCPISSVPSANIWTRKSGVVLLHDVDMNRLEVMSPIWVNGYPLDTDPITVEIKSNSVVSQTYRAAKPIYVKKVDEDSESHGASQRAWSETGIGSPAQGRVDEGRRDHRRGSL